MSRAHPRVEIGYHPGCRRRVRLTGTNLGAGVHTGKSEEIGGVLGREQSRSLLTKSVQYFLKSEPLLQGMLVSRVTVLESGVKGSTAAGQLQGTTIRHEGWRGDFVRSNSPTSQHQPRQILMRNRRCSRQVLIGPVSETRSGLSAAWSARGEIQDTTPS